MTVQEAQVDDLHEADEEEFVDELTPGTQLMHGQYTIESFLNSGGFGITYLARDSLDRLVVIKECFPGTFCRRQNASVVARSRAHQAELRSIVRLFTQEARSLAKAGHPNVVGVHQVFEDNGTAYMALDYVEGMDLLEIITETPGILTPQQINGYLTKMLDAISFVHDQGILHRDISPDNILVRADNEPVLIDFGAAREEASKQSRLLSALRVVKDGYSPQEFYVAGSEQSNSCDLYSLAASFYHIITGELPPDSQTRLAAAAAGDTDPYVPLGQRTNDYDEVFCTSLDKAMSVLPRERIQSAEDWLLMLKGEAPLTEPEPKRSRLATAPATVGAGEKSKMPILLGSTAVVLGLAAAGYFATQGGGEEVAATPAPTGTDVPFAPAPAPVTQPELAGTPELTAPLPELVAPQPEEVVAPQPELVTPQPELTETVQAPTGATQQDIPPAVGESDGNVEVALAPDLAPPATEEPFVNQSEPAAPPVTVSPVPEPRPTLDSLPEGVELVVPETSAPDTVASLPEGVELVVPETSALPEGVELVVPETSALPEGVELVVPETAALPEGVELVVPETSALPEGVELVVPETSALPEGVELVVPEANQLPEGVELVTPETSAPEVASNQLPAGVELVVPNAGPSEISSVMGDITVASLPFTFSATDPGVVETVLPGAPFWLVEGTRILTIAGEPATSTSESNALIKSRFSAQNGAVELPVTTEAQVSGAAIDRTLTLPVVHTTILLNGLGFEAREDDGNWITSVIAAPGNSPFEVGDEVVAFIPTSERITGPATFGDIMQTGLNEGRTDYSFAVRRDGQMWVESFTLTN